MPGESATSAPPRIGRLARLLAEVGASALRGEQRAGALEPLRFSRTFPAAPPAEGLREAVGRSGLFYESHLASWLRGEFPMARLRAEPQARFRAPETDPGEGARLARPSVATTVQPAAPGGLPSGLEAIVREQLATLATGIAVVPLEPWPGRRATLAIGREAAPRSPPGAEGAERWCATLRLELPVLGALAFTLRLAGGCVRIEAHAAQPAARRALLAGEAELGEALARASLALVRLEVAGDGG